MNKKYLFIAILILPICGIFLAGSALATQNPTYPSPAQCAGADWNIGLPNDITCSSNIISVDLSGGGDAKAQSIFGAASRLKPDLNSLNRFCREYTGDDTAQATYGRMHNYCTGCDQRLSWWGYPGWVTEQVCAGTLNVQTVKCVTNCVNSSSPDVKLIDAIAPATVKLGDTFQIKCNWGIPYLNCGIAAHSTGGCTYVGYEGSYAVFNCKATICGVQPNACNLFIYTPNAKCNKDKSDPIQSTTVTGVSHASKKCVGNAVYWFDSCDNQQELFQTCTGNQTCSNGSCTSNCTDHASKKCVGNAVYWFDSCNNQQELFQTCNSSQTCSSGQCVTQNIVCSSNADCSSQNGYIGNPYCQGNSVYQTYRTYTCQNPGTINACCVIGSETPQKKNDCTGSQTCSSGQCVNQNITCSSTSDCGTSGFIGSNFCSNGDVYKTYRTWTCNNPGTSNSSCSSSDQDQLQTDCTGSQTCSGGACVNQNITCSSTSDCGTSGFIGSNFCKNGDVYKTYRTYTCQNPGTSNSSCSSSDQDQLQTDCTGSQTCSGGSCSSNCTTNSYQQCVGNNLYWFDSCGNQQGLIQYCTNGCYNNSCQGTNCSYHSYQQCVGNNLYWFDSCGNQQGLIQYCTNGCYNNSCQGSNTYLSVQTNNATNISTNQVTLNGYVYSSGGTSYYNTQVWFEWGTSTSYGNETTHQSIGSSGNFSQTINTYGSNNTYYYRAVAQSNNGQIVYGQNMTFLAGGSQQTNLLTINKTVRNMTTASSGFASSVYANPSNVLMFMITIQATGNQSVSNVLVKDYLSSNLIYKDQVVVSGSSNWYGSNSGDIISGINLGTISSGQTITITYQAQVADASNFSYGTTTLTSNTSVTSSNSGYIPTSNATVYVTRTGVYGASSISTGLTNNFWFDSFFLPLMIALLGLWMWRSGIFFGIEKWLDNKKKTKSVYNSEKELKNRITAIQRTERI